MGFSRNLSSSEHEEQAALIDWWGAVARAEHASLLMAIPNGGERNALVARKLKSEGVRPGVPDLFLAIAAGGYHGLWIEMKRANGGKLSKEQQNMIELLRAQGYRAEVCHGWTKAMLVISEYLAGSDFMRGAEVGGVCNDEAE